MSATGPAKRAPNENSNLYEEKEIKLYKRHKKYYEDVVDITSAVWRRNRNYESLQVIRDINLFMSRYPVTGKFVSECDGCKEYLHWKRYKCLNCLNLVLCTRCCVSGKQPNCHLITHRMIQFR